MNEPQKRAAIDQATALFADTFPSMIARYLQSLKDSGVPEPIALLLTIEAQKAILSSMFVPGSREEQ